MRVRLQLQRHRTVAVQRLRDLVRRWLLHVVGLHRHLERRVQRLRRAELLAGQLDGRLYRVPDDGGLQHELAADGPELVRVQRGLRLERDAAGLRRAHALHARRDLLCVGLRTLRGLHAGLQCWPI